MRFLLVLCLTLLSVAISAETYRWVDPAGRTIISDTPPPGKAREVSRTGSGQAATSGDDLPFAVRKARENFPVILFTAADCTTECQQARELLNGRGVPFTEKMLQKAEDASELKALIGDVFVPSLKVGNQSFRGFEATAYHNLLDLAAYPKTAAYGSKPAGGLPPATEAKDAGQPAAN
ncbi:MAG: glutaredoxin family protein [Betaproteobacteria bacterium]|nr:glutaredoxin family protein [Betaproteobacteria bacterium]